MQEQLVLETEEQIRAFTHPYRLKILQAMREHGEPATATDIARLLGDGPGRVHYHVKILEHAGIIKLVDTLMINGILARRYEPSADHFLVKPETIQDDQKNDFYRMISKRFKNGLKHFFDSSFDTDHNEQSARPRSFLYEFNVYCNDEEWLCIQKELHELSKKFTQHSEGKKKRKIFIAGATESGNTKHTDETGTVLEELDTGLIWTFGFTGINPNLRVKPSIPHDE